MVALGSRLAVASLAAAIRHPPPRCCDSSQFSFSDTSLETLRKDQREFVDERGWAQFHTSRSLALALMGEVGEVAELLQWRSDDECRAGLPDWSAQEKVRLGEELADVLSYVMRLSDVAEIDLPAAFVDKMAKNREYIRPSRSIARRQSTPSTVPRREERPQRGETAAERPQRGGPRSRRSRRRSRGKMRSRSRRSRPRRVRASVSGACLPTWPKPTRVPPRESSSRQGGRLPQ